MSSRPWWTVVWASQTLWPWISSRMKFAGQMPVARSMKSNLKLVKYLTKLSDFSTFLFKDCIGVNGGRKKTIIELGEGQIPYGITITETNILWTDWVRRMVHRVDKMPGTRQASIPYALSHLGRPYDLVNIPAECPNMSNTCQGEPCGGGRLCLPDGRGNHSCK